jgi:hypothetical protein
MRFDNDDVLDGVFNEGPSAERASSMKRDQL